MNHADMNALCNQTPDIGDRYLSPCHQKLALRKLVLEGDIKELTQYMGTSDFSNQPALDQQLMHVQLQVMTVLVGTLGHRIQRATEA